MNNIFKIFVISGFVLFFGINCGSKKSDTWESIVNQHLGKYPEMEIIDFYKLVNDASIGPVRLGTDKKKILEYLKLELKYIKPNSELELIEKISPSDKYIRVNLPKFLALNGKPELLAEAISKSAAEKHDANVIEDNWQQVYDLIKSGKTVYTKEDIIAFDKLLEKDKYRFYYHSKIYKKQYSPSYRIVARKYWQEISQTVFNHN